MNVTPLLLKLSSDLTNEPFDSAVFNQDAILMVRHTVSCGLEFVAPSLKL